MKFTSELRDALGQPVRQATALACEVSMCHPKKERKKEPYKAEEQLNRSVLGQVCSSTLDAESVPPPGMASSGELSGTVMNANLC